MDVFLFFIIGIILSCVGILMVRYGLMHDEGEFYFSGFLCGVAGFFIFGSGAFRLGEEQGAYKQLRNEYEITYVINKDSCVIDTIINIR